MKNIYAKGVNVSAAIIFVGTWIYCISTYGFLLGVGLGWLASAITAAICAWFWPLLIIPVLFLGYVWAHDHGETDFFFLIPLIAAAIFIQINMNKKQQ